MKALHDAYGACRALASEMAFLITEVCVPISLLAECVVATQKNIADNGC